MTSQSMKSFDDLSVSTSTIVVPSNLCINFDWLYDIIEPIHIPISAKIKKNKQIIKYCQDNKIPNGSIIMIQKNSAIFKGLKIKKNKTKNKNKNTSQPKTPKHFRNNMLMAMYYEKYIMIKIPKTGKMHMVGCIDEIRAKKCMKYLWSFLSQYPQGRDSYYLVNNIYRNPNPMFLFTIVMVDVVFKFEFNINNISLDENINMHTEFNSLLETVFGYTAVNIKSPFYLNYDEMTIPYLMLDQNGDWSEGAIPYREYLQSLDFKEQEKIFKKHRRNTFLVFHSGTTIMSGMTRQYMRDVYYKFVDTIIKLKPSIEEMGDFNDTQLKN